MRRSRFSEHKSIGTNVPSQSSALRLVSLLIRSTFSAKAFHIIISSQPLSTYVLQRKGPLGITIFSLYTYKACLFAGLLLYGENVQIMTVFFCLLGIFLLLFFTLLSHLYFLCFRIFNFPHFCFFSVLSSSANIQATVFVPISNNGSFRFLVFFSSIGLHDNLPSYS